MVALSFLAGLLMRPSLEAQGPEFEFLPSLLMFVMAMALASTVSHIYGW